MAKEILTTNLVSTVINFTYQNLPIIRNIFGCPDYDEDSLYVYLPERILRHCNNIDSITELFYKNNKEDVNELILTGITTEDEFNELDKKITSKLHSQGLPVKNNTIIGMELIFGLSCSSVGVAENPRDIIGARKTQIIGAMAHGFKITNFISRLIHCKECLIKAGIQEESIKMIPFMTLYSKDDN
jgi:hypothetical protein